MLFFLKKLLYDYLLLYSNLIKLSVCNIKINNIFVKKN